MGGVPALLRRLVVITAGATALAVQPAPASGSAGAVAYTGAPVHVSAAARIDFHALARFDRSRHGEAGTAVAAGFAEPPEPQEQAEPNVRFTVPSPLLSPLAAPATLSPVPSPYVSASFLAQPDLPGIGTTRTESPPDTNGAVGRDKLMVTLNSNYMIERKSDGKVLDTVSMTTFWELAGTHNPFDPRVLYDPYSDRWLVTAGDDPLLPSSKILYGISDTSDPQGSWHLYAIDADPTNATWADFPTVGFSHGTVALAVNMFASSSLTYVRGRLLVFDYDSLRAGGDGRPLDIAVPGAFALQPAVTYTAAPTPVYLVEQLDSLSATYRFWSLSDGKLTLVGGAPRTNPLGPWATPGPGNLLPQDDGGGIDTGDARIGNAVFRNGHVWYAQTIGLPPGGTGYAVRSAVQWAELDKSGAFVQGGRVEDPRTNPWNGGHSYAFAALAVNAQNDVLVGFSDFESDDFADAGYAFRAGTDPPGTMRAPVTLKDGEGPYEKRRETGRNRWGDYSGAQVDPSDDLALWVVQEYAGLPAGPGDDAGRWGTWWGRVGGGRSLAPPQCLVPNVVGNRYAKAWRRIAAARCRRGHVRSVKAAKKQRGRVLRQHPAAGRLLASDSKISLVVGR
jgi:hypothetical protein